MSRNIPPAYGSDVWRIALRQLYEGRASAQLALAAAPTAGKWAQGDVVRNNAPAKVTGGSFDYVLFGWICTVAGEPGTWEEMRIPCA